MNELLAQIILAVRRRGTEGWMNILVVVVIAVVYGLSTILKAKAKKPSEKEEREGPLGRKPGSKLKEIAERFKKELSELSRDRMYQPPQRTEGLQKESFQQARRPGGPTPGRPYRPGVQQSRAEVAAAPRAVEKFAPEAERPNQLQTEIPEAEHLPEILSDYADPDDLRRAILHYEILGRPLSLRDPSGQIIGL